MSQHYSFDSLIDYRIEIAGHFDMELPEWLDEETVTIAPDSSNVNITILIGTFDQARLIGLLRCLVYLGLPLISVNSVEGEMK